jgi:putative sterol carrier protein
MPQFAKLEPLVKGAVKTPKDFNLDEATKNLAKRIEQARATGSFEVHILEEKEPLRLDLTGGKAAATKGSTGKPDFAVKGSRETMAQIASGELSPVDAYLNGRLEVHGDLDFGKRLLAKLAAKGGELEF